MRQLLILSLLFCFGLTAQSRTLYVDATTGDPSYDGLSPIFTGGTNGPKQTPQQAINLYQSGDTVFIANGNYSAGPGAIIDIKNQAGITIIGESTDSVIIDATGRQFGVSISTSTTNPIRDITIKNLTIYHTNGGSSPAHALIWKGRNILFDQVKVIGPGQFNAPGANAVGIKVMESDTVELRDIEVSFCEGNGIEFGGGTGHITLHNISILAASTDLSNGGIFFRTSSAGIYPAGNLEVSSWTGLLELDSCYNGIVFESQNGTISLNFTGSSIIEDNVFLDGASFGSNPPSTATLKQMGFFYLGTIGVLPGAETYFAVRQDLLDLTVNPAYVTASIGSNIDRTQFYLAGDMVASLAVNNTSPGDSLIFIGMDFSDVDLQVNKPLYLWAEDNRVTLNSLNVNGSGAEARLINDFITEEELVLTNGILYTDDFNRITMRPGCNVVGGSQDAYVNGPILAQVASTGPELVRFPSGLTNTFRPIDLSISQSTTDTGTYKVEMDAFGGISNAELPGTINRAFDAHYWNFSAQNASNFLSASATISYEAADGVFDTAGLRVIFNDDLVGAWSDLGGRGSSIPAGTISSNLFTESGYLALANAMGGGNFTGIELLDNTSINIYPNPASTSLSIQMVEGTEFSHLQMIDNIGRLVSDWEINNRHDLIISVENLPKGLYTLYFSGKSQGYRQVIIR